MCVCVCVCRERLDWLWKSKVQQYRIINKKFKLFDELFDKWYYYFETSETAYVT